MSDDILVSDEAHAHGATLGGLRHEGLLALAAAVQGTTPRPKGRPKTAWPSPLYTPKSKGPSKGEALAALVAKYRPLAPPGKPAPSTTTVPPSPCMSEINAAFAIFGPIACKLDTNL